MENRAEDAAPEEGSPPRRDRRRASVVAQHHNVTLAALVAMALPGMGQFYNGQPGKGALVLLASVAWLVSLAFRPRPFLAASAEWLVGICLWLAGILDACVVAGRHVRREPVGLWRWF